MSGADSTTEVTPTGRYEDHSLSVARNNRNSRNPRNGKIREGKLKVLRFGSLFMKHAHSRIP